MGKHKEKQKTKHPGFGLRLASAFILMLFIILFFSAYCFYRLPSVHSNSFIEWFCFDSRENLFIGGRYEVILNDGTFEFVSDKQYDDWDTLTVRFTSNGYDYYDGPVASVHWIDTVYHNDVYYFFSENTKAKTATFKSESGEALIFSYENFETYHEFIELNGWISLDGRESFLYFLLFIGILFAINILLFVSILVSEQHNWGNDVCIAFGIVICFASGFLSSFLLYMIHIVDSTGPHFNNMNVFLLFSLLTAFTSGLFACAGGKEGNKYFKKGERKYEPPANVQPTSQKTTESNEKRSNIFFLKKLKAYFKKESPDQGTVGTFITLTISFIVIFSLSLVSFFTNFLGLFNESEKICKTLSMGVIAISMTYFIYLGFHNPFKHSNRWILITIGVIYMLICDYLMYIASTQILSNGPVALLIIAITIIIEVGYLIGYGYWCKGLPSAMNIAVCFLFPILSLLIVAAFLLICFIRFAIFFIKALFEVGGIVFGNDSGVKAFKAALRGEDYQEEKKTYKLHVDGYERTLTYQEYYNGHDRYRDDVGNFWYSDDGGKTFYRE